MLLAAWATTSPTTAIANRPQSTATPPLVRAASAASSPPIRPDQIVIGKTAARVMTSHLPMVSIGRVLGGLAVSRISFQPSNRSFIESGVAATGTSLAAVLIGGAAPGLALGRDWKRAPGMYHVVRAVDSADARR